MFVGPEGVVADMIKACGRGPISARVDRVQEDVGTADLLNLRGAGERFAFLPTV